MTGPSRIPGFYKLSPADRRAALIERTRLDTADMASLSADSLDLDRANLMVENVVGTFALPLGVGVNFTINNRDVLVPMVVEEPSVVAAVSNMARLVRLAGGFRASNTGNVMFGQIQVLDVPDLDRAVLKLEQAHATFMAEINRIHPRLVERGGGARGVHIRKLRYDEPGQTPEDILVVQFALDCVDAMGANMVNTVAEALAPQVESITGGRVLLRILSNLASERRAIAECTIPSGYFDTPSLSGRDVVNGIAAAYRFAWADPWRAATHNKGIMNGVDAVALATGNDWRAIEAGAHAWAARDGQYRSLTRWTVGSDGALHGSIDLPIQVGTVGGCIRNHPGAAANHKMLGAPRAAELAEIMAAVGLAQNLGALRALATEGIQEGHMRMHSRNLAVQAGARPEEIPTVVAALSAERDWSVGRAQSVLATLRGTGDDGSP
ncbi:MAG: hydroxymethylglutaryl-CoA reductase, degradative [Deltaproteobacteria bacterium]|nr:hydroxymethylglutaryl-CoA reductase, degradative [Deltaproteobacteria bacterium]HCH66214.1 hydroxymethylglutaryl-CoA reductase, degradative [Deltaproteobacteria bacterium]